MDWLDLLAVQRTLKSLLQHQSSKASILQCSAFFTADQTIPYSWDLLLPHPCEVGTIQQGSGSLSSNTGISLPPHSSTQSVWFPRTPWSWPCQHFPLRCEFTCSLPCRTTGSLTVGSRLTPLWSSACLKAGQSFYQSVLLYQMMKMSSKESSVCKVCLQLLSLAFYLPLRGKGWDIRHKIHLCWGETSKESWWLYIPRLSRDYPQPATLLAPPHLNLAQITNKNT